MTQELLDKLQAIYDEQERQGQIMQDMLDAMRVDAPTKPQPSPPPPPPKNPPPTFTRIIRRMLT